MANLRLFLSENKFENEIAYLGQLTLCKEKTLDELKKYINPFKRNGHLPAEFIYGLKKLELNILREGSGMPRSQRKNTLKISHQDLSTYLIQEIGAAAFLLIESVYPDQAMVNYLAILTILEKSILEKSMSDKSDHILNFIQQYVSIGIPSIDMKSPLVVKHDQIYLVTEDRGLCSLSFLKALIVKERPTLAQQINQEVDRIRHCINEVNDEQIKKQSSYHYGWK